MLPEIETPSIEGLKLERLTVPADDKAVMAKIEEFAAQMKRFEDAPKTKKAAQGDQVIIDFAGSVDGVAFDGGTGEDMAVEIGSGQLIPGFEDQLVGTKVGDEKVLKVTFPDEYPVETLKGKPAEFAITVKELKVPAASKIDDEFAKSLGLESLDKLKELMKDQVEQELNGLTRTYMKRKLLDQLAAAHDFDVPPTMVEAEFAQIWQQLEHEVSHEEDPEAAKAELENDRDDYHAIAVRRVRLGLLLSEIGQAHGVQVSNQEMQRLIAQAAQQYRPKTARASSNMCSRTRSPRPSFAPRSMKTRSSTSCSKRPRSATAKPPARNSKPRSKPTTTAMSMARAAATTMTTTTSSPRRLPPRSRPPRRMRGEGRSQGRRSARQEGAGEEGRSRSRQGCRRKACCRQEGRSLRRPKPKKSRCCCAEGSGRRPLPRNKPDFRQNKKAGWRDPPRPFGYVVSEFEAGAAGTAAARP